MDRYLDFVARIALLVSAAVILAACNSTDQAVPATGTPVSQSQSQSPPTSSPPSVPSEPPWRSAYTADQLAAYDSALARFNEYEQRSEPLWAAGKATAAAEQVFKTYYASPAWRQVFDQLKTYEQVEVTRSGLPMVVWSRAKTVTGGVDAGSVTLLQCVDYTSTSATQYGKPAPKDRVFLKPVERIIVLKRSPGSTWLIYENHEPTKENYHRCAAGGGGS
jgi:hypothetical protein